MSKKSMTVLCAATLIAVTGCDAITSHPSIPPEAKQIMQEGVATTRGLSAEVETFVSGFGFVGEDRLAAAQLTKAMLMVFNIHNTASLMNAAIEIKRAQVCLVAVGVESAKVTDRLSDALFHDPKVAALWTQMEDLIAGLNLNEMDRYVCNHRGEDHALR